MDIYVGMNIAYDVTFRPIAIEGLYAMVSEEISWSAAYAPALARPHAIGGLRIGSAYTDALYGPGSEHAQWLVAIGPRFGAWLRSLPAAPERIAWWSCYAADDAMVLPSLLEAAGAMAYMPKPLHDIRTYAYILGRYLKPNTIDAAETAYDRAMLAYRFMQELRSIQSNIISRSYSAGLYDSLGHGDTSDLKGIY